MILLYKKKNIEPKTNFIQAINNNFTSILSRKFENLTNKIQLKSNKKKFIGAVYQKKNITTN